MSRDEVLMDFVVAVTNDEKLPAVHQHGCNDVAMYPLLVVSNDTAALLRIIAFGSKLCMLYIMVGK